jgi:hypothetical protein
MQRRKKLSIRAEFCVWGKHYDEIIITWGGLHLGENFEVDFWEGCMSKYAVQRGIFVPTQRLL